MQRKFGRALIAAVAIGLAGVSGAPAAEKPAFRAGAAAVDIAPATFPVIVSGGVTAQKGEAIRRPVFVRGLVLDNGQPPIAIAVVDTLFVPRAFCDAVKQRIAQELGIPPQRILISATHTHSAPCLEGCLGTETDEAYARFLPDKIVECLKRAAERRVPAEAGWTTVDVRPWTHCRQWILRPDRLRHDPFGELTVRSQMHPGYQHPDFLGPAGPDEPGLTLLSIRARDGRPLALLANYSMHYFGDGPVSSDYFGEFCRKIEQRLGPGDPQRPPVAIMAQGTAGDQHWMDYGQPPKKDLNLETYAEHIVQAAWAAYETIGYTADVPLAMAQRQVTLARRVPNGPRLRWATSVMHDLGQRPPQSWAEVYAREQLFIDAQPRRELVLQAVRIGGLGITAIPNEVFGITGLKLKARSPLVPTMNIELANGCEGYIPPPEQHRLGGYTTWPARTAGLEVDAEPQIVEAVLGLLEEVAGKPRRSDVAPTSPLARAVLAAQPLFFWRLNDYDGVQATDASPAQHSGVFEGGFALRLPGADRPGLTVGGYQNAAVHLAGGRIRTPISDLGQRYTLELWFCNRLPVDAREMTGHLWSLAADQTMGLAGGEHLGLGGTRLGAGKVVLYTGIAADAKAALVGRSEITVGTWRHLALVRDGRRVRVYLDGQTPPEIDGQLPPQPAGRWAFVGGRGDNQANFEGLVDEVALYARALPPEEIAAHVRAATADHSAARTNPSSPLK